MTRGKENYAQGFATPWVERSFHVPFYLLHEHARQGSRTRVELTRLKRMYIAVYLLLEAVHLEGGRALAGVLGRPSQGTGLGLPCYNGWNPRLLVGVF